MYEVFMQLFKIRIHRHIYYKIITSKQHLINLNDKNKKCHYTIICVFGKNKIFKAKIEPHLPALKKFYLAFCFFLK